MDMYVGIVSNISKGFWAVGLIHYETRNTSF